MASSSQLQGTRRRSNLNDFISQMSDDILVMILSLLSLKEAVVTSSLSTRWRFLWCNLTKLNFDGGETLYKIYMNPTLHDSEWSKYINQVNNVIQSYNHAIIQDFRIRFDPANNRYGVINEWLQFAVNKKVEFLELDFSNEGFDIYEDYEYYDFPLCLCETNLSRRSSLNSAIVEIPTLKKLILKKVNLTESVLQQFLTNCPHLETIVIHDSIDLKHFRVSGRAFNLKHIEIDAYCFTKSIYLSDFDLVSFKFIGSVKELRLSNLPKLKEVDISDGYGMFSKNVSKQLSSCALSLQVLSMRMSHCKESLSSDLFPELPSIKELRLVIDVFEDTGLMYLASMLNALPNLVTCTLKPQWRTWSSISRRNAQDVTNPKEHLKILKIEGYNGDVEPVKYIVHIAVALKKIVIDPFRYHRSTTDSERTNVRLPLASVLPQGVDLCIV